MSFLCILYPVIAHYTNVETWTVKIKNKSYGGKIIKKKQNHITYTNLHKQGQTGRMVRHISRPPRRDSDVKSEGEHGEPQSLHEKKCYYELLTGKERKYYLGAVCGWLCV